MARSVSVLVLLTTLPLFTYATEPQAGGVVAAVQRLFDAMASRDVDTARALFTPDATLTSVRQDGTPVVTPVTKWLEHWGATKDTWLERMWNPKTMEDSSIAVVWAEYDFHLNGKFHHCGIDSFNLLKTGNEWKIADVVYTSKTSGCSPSPLGPPAK